MFSLLRFVPKNHLSYLTGKFVNLRLPRFLNQLLLRWYCKRYRVKMDEFVGSLEDYPSLGQFFQRDLRPGLRPLGEGVLSPVDGRLDEGGLIEQGRLIQAKGKYYQLEGLLGSTELASEFEGGCFLTFYLAPGDYHHIHAPVDGTIVRACHVKGTLWPVNNWSVANIPELFTINERITTVLDSAYGPVAVVKVGATNVGSITTTYNSFVGNSELSWFGQSAEPSWENFDKGIPIQRGERLGSFCMGSTVVLIFKKGVVSPEFQRGPIRYGVSLQLSHA